MTWHGAVWIEFCERFPARYPFLLEGPAPRLLINRAWWQASSPAQRAAAFRGITARLELPGTLLWSTRQRPGEQRLVWAWQQSRAWWEALIAQEPEAHEAPPRHGLPDRPT